MDQHYAQATNLIFFIPTSITAIISVIKNKLIIWKIGIPIAISGIIGATIGAQISMSMEVKILKKTFGIFLAIIAIYESYSLIKKYIFNKTANTNKR